MKSINARVCLCLIATLFIWPISFASEGNEATELKGGGSIVVTEKIEEDVSAAPTKEETKVQAPVTKAASPNATSPATTNKAEDKEEPAVEKSPVNYDQKAAEINDRINKEYKENIKETKEEPAPKKETPEKPKETKPAETSKASESPSKKVTDAEINDLINQLNATTNEIEGSMKEYKNTVNKVNEAIKSSNVSKEDSAKITEKTKSIMKEYQPKIDAAQTPQQKEALAKKAEQEINQTIKTTSKEAYDIIQNQETKEENNEKLTIDDQKGDTILVEIDARTQVADTNDNDPKEAKPNKVVTKSTALTRSPRLSQETSKKPTYPITIIVVILLIITISIGLTIALKEKDKKRN